MIFNEVLLLEKNKKLEVRNPLIKEAKVIGKILKQDRAKKVIVFKYIFITISGLFLRATIISLIGWQAGELYYINAKQIAAIENYLLIGFLFLALIGAIFLFYKKRQYKLNSQ